MARGPSISKSLGAIEGVRIKTLTFRLNLRLLFNYQRKSMRNILESFRQIFGEIIKYKTRERGWYVNTYKREAGKLARARSNK